MSTLNKFLDDLLDNPDLKRLRALRGIEEEIVPFTEKIKETVSDL